MKLRTLKLYQLFTQTLQGILQTLNFLKNGKFWHLLSQSNSDVLSNLFLDYTQKHIRVDTVCSSSTNNENDEILYSKEFLNLMKFQGIPSHELAIKVGVPVMLLKAINQIAGLCNGTRLIVTQLATRVIEAEVMTGSTVGFFFQGYPYFLQKQRCLFFFVKEMPIPC